MPLPRKSSPRRSSRRSRSRSHSPKTSHRRSRSRSREKRRSRSPREKKKYAERHKSRSRSRERKRSRSYEDKRRSRSDSPPKHRAKSPNRRGSTPDERSYPVKRLADSSGKHASYRSKSRSPAPAKKSKDYRYKSESPEYSHRKPSKHRSPSPHKGRHADEPSSSSMPRKRANSRNKDEIDYVKIIDPTPRGKLTKRFTTPEQKVQGPFDFEENITIGIYRGPHHMELDDDVPVNYDFNPKTFVMLHPKKDYHKPVFEREEILAFKHDDILDEEAYVEKRTITVKPPEKKSSKWSNQSDYKITVGSDSYGDRRKVQDSGSKSRTSRRDSYEHDVTVRLDPKPDPRYEKMYREQKRHGEADLMDEKIQRNPNDLRYSLLRKDRDTDRDYARDGERSGDRSGDRGMVDARSKIQARRHEGQRDYRSEGHSGSSPGDMDKSKYFALPDFKNRPDNALEVQRQWGYCKICRVPINSERQAYEHVNGEQHLQNEARKFGRAHDDSRPPPALDHSPFPRKRYSDESPALPRKRFTEEAASDPISDYEDLGESSAKKIQRSYSKSPVSSRSSPLGEDSQNQKLDRPGINASKHTRPVKLENGCHVWIIGTGEMEQAFMEAKSQNIEKDLDLDSHNITIRWRCKRCLKFDDVLPAFEELSKSAKRKPDAVMLHVGGNDLQMTNVQFEVKVNDIIDEINKRYPGIKVIWGQILPRFTGIDDTYTMNLTRTEKDDNIATMLVARGGHYVRYPNIQLRIRNLYDSSEDGDIKMLRAGVQLILQTLKSALLSIVVRNISVTPNLTDLGPKMRQYVGKNLDTIFKSRKQNAFIPGFRNPAYRPGFKKPFFQRKPFYKKHY